MNTNERHTTKSSSVHHHPVSTYRYHFITAFRNIHARHFLQNTRSPRLFSWVARAVCVVCSRPKQPHHETTSAPEYVNHEYRQRIHKIPLIMIHYFEFLVQILPVAKTDLKTLKHTFRLARSLDFAHEPPSPACETSPDM